MSTRKYLFTYQAQMMGKKVYELLSLSELRGSLIAVFSAAAYLAAENGEIFWITKRNNPLHQRSVTISYCPDLFTAGESFYGQGSHLQIGERIVIFTDQASLWQAPDPDIGNIPSLPELVSNFQNWLPAFPKIPHPWNQICNRFCSAGASSSKQEIDYIIEKSSKLIGLGGGFSPAGDDFVGGLLFVVHHLRKAYSKYLRVDEEMMASFLERARRRTNLISWTILKDLAFGQGPEPVHKIVTNLFQGKSLDTIWSEIDELARIGHTTGKVIFFGMLTGLRLILGGDDQKHGN